MYSTAESGDAPCIMFPEYERTFKGCFNKGNPFLSSVLYWKNVKVAKELALLLSLSWTSQLTGLIRWPSLYTKIFYGTSLLLPSTEQYLYSKFIKCIQKVRLVKLLILHIPKCCYYNNWKFRVLLPNATLGYKKSGDGCYEERQEIW